MGCDNSKPEVQKENPLATSGKEVARVRDTRDNNRCFASLLEIERLIVFVRNRKIESMVGFEMMRLKSN